MSSSDHTITDESKITPATREWPPHLRVGSIRFMRRSAHYETTIAFYRELVALPVIDEFRNSYGEDGTIFGLPDWPVHLEVVRAKDDRESSDQFDELVFYFPSEEAVEHATHKLRASGVNPTPNQHPYWEDFGGVTFLDPDGRKIVYVSWVYGVGPSS